MADLKRTIDLVFKGTDETGAATRAALDNASKFSQSIGNVTGPLSDFTQGAVKFEAGLLAVGAAVTAFSVKTAGDFDAAFREISTLIDEPIESLNEFRQAILDYAGNSTQSLDSINTAVYNAISAGVEYTDALELVRQSEQLAVAGKADLDSSLRLVISSLNAYGESTERAGDFSDILFTAVEKGQLTLPELADGLARVTGIANSAGIPFEELNAAIAGLTATGLPVEQAISAIRGAITNIIKPTADAKRAAEELGIQFNASGLESKGFAGLLNEVIQASDGNVETIGRLFGSVEGLGAVLALGSGGAEKFADAISAMDDRAGATATAYEKMAESISLVNQRLANNVEILLERIGRPLLDEYGSIADGLVAIFNSIGVQVSDGALGDIVQVIEEILADAGNSLARIAELLPEVDFTNAANSVIAGLNAIRESVEGLTGIFELGTPEGIAEFAELIGKAFQALSEFSAGTLESVGALVEFIANNGLEEVVDFAQSWADTAGKIGAAMIAINLLLPAINTLLIALQAIVPLMGAKGLAAAAGTAATTIGTLAVKFAPGGALIVGVGFAVSKIAELVDILLELERANEDARESQERLWSVNRQSYEALQEVADQLGLTIRSYDEFNKLVADGVIVADEASGKWRLASEAVEEVGESAGTSGERVRSGLQVWKDAAQQSIDTLKGTAQFLQEVGFEQPFAGAADATQGWIKTIEDGIPTFRQAGRGVTDSMAEAEKAIDEAVKKSESFQIEMAKIASDEYIAIIDARVELDIAKLEDETKRVELAFDSIDNTIESTGETLSNMFGVLGEFSANTREWREIMEAINVESDRRDDALTMQKELTGVQIEFLRERMRTMARGDALLTVDGAGLQPHLEAFMWEILRTIQVRVNEDGLDMLLGVQ